MGAGLVGELRGHHSWVEFPTGKHESQIGSSDLGGHDCSIYLSMGVDWVSGTPDCARL